MPIEYREPTDENEMESIFRLRYTVYADDKHLNTMITPSAAHDINEFDKKALHFAGFDGKNPVAYIRITTGHETLFAPWVQNIVSLNNIVVAKHPASFPFQQYYPDSDWALGFIESLKGRKIGEVGKLAIHKNYRTGGVVLNDLVSSFVNYCKNDQKFNTGFGICTHELERYYRKFGFSIVEGSRPFVYDKLPEAVLVKFDDH